jgi:hypothetical protein
MSSSQKHEELTVRELAKQGSNRYCVECGSIVSNSSVWVNM